MSSIELLLKTIDKQIKLLLIDPSNPAALNQLFDLRKLVVAIIARNGIFADLNKFKKLFKGEILAHIEAITKDAAIEIMPPSSFMLELSNAIAELIVAANFKNSELNEDYIFISGLYENDGALETTDNQQLKRIIEIMFGYDLSQFQDQMLAEMQLRKSSYESIVEEAHKIIKSNVAVAISSLESTGKEISRDLKNLSNFYHNPVGLLPPAGMNYLQSKLITHQEYKDANNLLEILEQILARKRKHGDGEDGPAKKKVKEFTAPEDIASSQHNNQLKVEGSQNRIDLLDSLEEKTESSSLESDDDAVLEEIEVFTNTFVLFDDLCQLQKCKNQLNRDDQEKYSGFFQGLEGCFSAFERATNKENEVIYQKNLVLGKLLIIQLGGTILKLKEVFLKLPLDLGLIFNQLYQHLVIVSEYLIKETWNDIVVTSNDLLGKIFLFWKDKKNSASANSELGLKLEELRVLILEFNKESYEADKNIKLLLGIKKFVQLAKVDEKLGAAAEKLKEALGFFDKLIPWPDFAVIFDDIVAEPTTRVIEIEQINASLSVFRIKTFLEQLELLQMKLQQDASFPPHESAPVSLLKDPAIIVKEIIGAAEKVDFSDRLLPLIIIEKLNEISGFWLKNNLILFVKDSLKELSQTIELLMPETIETVLLMMLRNVNNLVLTVKSLAESNVTFKTLLPDFLLTVKRFCDTISKPDFIAEALKHITIAAGAFGDTKAKGNYAINSFVAHALDDLRQTKKYFKLVYELPTFTRYWPQAVEQYQGWGVLLRNINPVEKHPFSTQSQTSATNEITSKKSSVFFKASPVVSDTKYAKSPPSMSEPNQQDGVEEFRLK